MKTRGQTAVCREGWYYLVVLGLVLGGGMLRDINLLLMLGGILAGPLLFNWRAVVRTLRGLKVQRKVPPGVCAGDLLVVYVTLNNTRRWSGSWGLLVEEQIRREGASRRQRSVRPGVLFPYIPAGQSRNGVYRGRLPQRGRYRLGPLRISTRFPFGLFRRTITVGQTDTLVVFPRLGRLTPRWHQRHYEAFAGTRRREHRPGSEGDFYGVREWRPGDSQRWIHWRTSARVGKLAVRQFEQPRNRDLAVLVDPWQPQDPAPEHQENVELAVSFAATVMADVCRKGGANVLLGTAGSKPDCTGGPASAALLKQAMQRLALVEPHSRSDAAEKLLGSVLCTIESGTEVVLVSTRPVEAGEASSLASLSSDRPDSGRRRWRRRVRCISTSDGTLQEYFQPE